LNVAAGRARWADLGDGQGQGYSYAGADLATPALVAKTVVELALLGLRRDRPAPRTANPTARAARAATQDDKVGRTVAESPIRATMATAAAASGAEADHVAASRCLAMVMPLLPVAVSPHRAAVVAAHAMRRLLLKCAEV
jgi:hypothetical protein